MSINITHTTSSFQFENKENLKNTAKQILNKQDSSTETMQKILDQTIFAEQSTQNSQWAILKASSQITLNNSLKETLKYLKSHANKNTKKEPVFGELWNIMSENNKQDFDYDFQDFEIDESAENIFIAA